MMVKKAMIRATCAFLLLALWAAQGELQAAKRGRPRPEDAKRVELFSGMKTGEIEVKFIPKDARSANVMIKNLTERPLSIVLPEAFAGLPVLAQFDDFGGGGGGFGGDMGGGGLGGGGGGGQGMGGGFGGMGMGGGMGGFGGGGFGGFGGGMFNVAPEKVGKITVRTLCLEHGKDDPTPRMKYTIAPITSLSKDPRVAEVCKMVARGEVPQNAAQAAAWHLTDQLSWRELALKDRVRSRFGHVKYFTPQELQLAMGIVSAASTRAEAFGAPEMSSPGELEQQQVTSRIVGQQ
jgi:hypothetical protein